MCRLEMIIPYLKHLPKGQMRTGSMAREVRWCHAERIGLDLECRPLACERVVRQRIDLGDLLVSHGVATARCAVAVDHEKAAVAVVRFIEGVGKAGIDCQIE